MQEVISIAVNERREIELKNKDKTVHKMSRDGLTEKNLSKGTTKNVSSREKDVDFDRPSEGSEVPSGSTDKGHKPHSPVSADKQAPADNGRPADQTDSSPLHRPAGHSRQKAYKQKYDLFDGDKPDGDSNDSRVSDHAKTSEKFTEKRTARADLREEKDQPPPGKRKGKLKIEPDADSKSNPGGDSDSSYSRQSKLDHAEQKAKKASVKAQDAKDKVPKKKKLKSRLEFDEVKGKQKRKFYFEEQPRTKPGLVESTEKKAGRAVSLQAHRKMYQVERENVGTQAAHRTELTAEATGRGIARIRGTKTQWLQKKAARMEKKAVKARSNLAYERTLKKNPKLAKEGAVKKALHKRQIQKKYIKQAKKRAKQAEKTARTGTKAVARIAGAIARHPVATAIFIIVLVLMLLLSSLFGILGTGLGQGGLTMLGGTYVAGDEAMNQAELYYTELETDLYFSAYALERANPGYDEYRYNLRELSHNPYELMAYLNAVYNEFTFEDVQAELDSILAQQYNLWTEETIEVRTETRTVAVGESIGSVRTSAYCPCRICCGPYANGITASGTTAKANHTVAVDAYNPILPMGTKVVIGGVEYTVEDTGNLNANNVDFDIYFDTHQEALNWGKKNKDAYLAEGNENEVEVTTTYEYSILEIKLSSSLLSNILYSRMNDAQTRMYELYMTTKGMRFYFSAPFEDLDWTAYVSSYYGYRVHPTTGNKNLHSGVDIAVAYGTPIQAVQHGTVTYAGWDDSYGYYVIIEDTEEGLKSLYAHCSSLAVATGQTITRGDTIGYVGSTGTSTGNHLHLEVYRDGVNLNPLYFVDPGSGGEWTGGGMAGYPGEAYDDETYQKLLAEAVKYIGMPYTWGGGSPSTGFDCSGFVSWVYTASGVYNLGRDTAQGIYNRCAAVSASEAKPGDLVFFHSTYSTTSYVTHIGIYVGNNTMLHCGNPIGYVNLGSSYWQQHLIGFGRLV